MTFQMENWTPNLAQQALRESMERLASLDGYKRKVLVVDDNPDDAYLLSLMLAPYRLDVATCTEKDKAVEWIVNSKYDLVFLDIIMVQDGLQVLKQVKELKPEQSFVIVTGMDESMLREEALKLGAAMFITKPITERQLTEIFGQLKA